MKHIATSFLLVLAGVTTVSTATAAVFNIDISPAAGALNLGANPYTNDHAVGLAALNETAQPVSFATGNEVGGGIVYDDLTNALTFDFAYGSDFGFVDLGGTFTDVHIHGPGTVNFPAVNTSAGVIHPLLAFHAAGSTVMTGRVTGMVVLTAGEETDLFSNALYLNIHSDDFPAGEIRGQLIAVPEPSSATLLALMLGTGMVFTRRRRKAVGSQV